MGIEVALFLPDTVWAERFRFDAFLVVVGLTRLRQIGRLT
jgi:hypothetical protein